MPARRVTTVTMPVDGRSGVAFEAYDVVRNRRDHRES